MRQEKSPGLKILWLWTFGTAAVLVATVVRTRLRDMEALMKAEEEQQPQPPASSSGTNSALLDSAPELELVQEDKRSI